MPGFRRCQFLEVRLDPAGVGKSSTCFRDAPACCDQLVALDAQLSEARCPEQTIRSGDQDTHSTSSRPRWPLSRDAVKHLCVLARHVPMKSKATPIAGAPGRAALGRPMVIRKRASRLFAVQEPRAHPTSGPPQVFRSDEPGRDSAVPKEWM
jgi:hypothetical protein